MYQDLVTFEAASPEELTEVIKRFSSKDTRNCLYSALAISDPRLLIYPFNFKDIPVAEAKRQVREEIREIYSIPIAAIEYDFQIFRNESEYVSGICTAIPKKILYRYLSVLDKNKLVPMRIVPYSSAIIDYYFQKHKDPHISFCIIDFSKKFVINLAIFKNDRCELLRTIPYELLKLNEAKSEIIESLKNTCLMTDVKKIDYIYFAGTLEDKLDIIHEVEGAFKAKVERDDTIDVVTALSLDDYYFNINFSKNYVFSQIERQHALNITTLILALYALFIVFLGFETFRKGIDLKHLNASYTVVEYDYAKNLQKEINAL